MSSSILNKRIIVDLATEDNSSPPRLKLNNDELDDSSPPVKKPFLANIPNSVNEETVSDDESTLAASSLVSVSDCTPTESAVIEREINDEDEGKKSKTKSKMLWMKVGVTKREPRVGSDFQAMIE